MNAIIDCIEPDQFALLVSLFAIAIADGLDANETNSLGSFIVAVGSTMQLISAQQVLLAGKNNNSTQRTGVQPSPN